MCGIYGIVSAAPLTPQQTRQVSQAAPVLRHRGPDGQGEYHSPHVQLGMRRLAIIDLEGGQQPLYNEDRSLALVANGEIYNYVELREELEARGHRFRTGSDCETILHLYEEHGADCVQHLRGMFALALWDYKQQRLLLARDRMGEKPLYICRQGHTLLFASELKALLQTGLVPLELDPQAIDLYFHYQYVPEPATPIRAIRKLDAGCALLIDAAPWRVEEQRYWRMEDAPPLSGNPAELIRRQLEETARLVIRSDVPVGVALSGGLDSSLIAALAARVYPGTMSAFSVGYPGRPDSDERTQATALANHLGMPFHDVELRTGELVELFPDLVEAADDPIADISALGYFAVSRLARQHGVKVLLQGQGGDELFWGYPWLREAAVRSALKAGIGTHPGQLLRYLGAALTGERLAHAQPAGRGIRASLCRGLACYRQDRNAAANRMVFYDLSPDYQHARDHARSLYSRDWSDQLQEHDPASLFTLEATPKSIDVALIRLVCDTYLRENGLAQGDRLSMANSVELRVPLVDYRLVETVIGLTKVHGRPAGPPKQWLRQAARGLLPQDVMARPKRGFTPPVHQWYHALLKEHGSLLADGALVGAGVLDRQVARTLPDEPFPRGLSSPLAFKALVLETWCRRMTAAAAIGQTRLAA